LIKNEIRKLIQKMIQKFLMSQEKLKEEVLNIAKEESWT